MLERTDHQLCMPELMAAKLAATAPNGGSVRCAMKHHAAELPRLSVTQWQFWRQVRKLARSGCLVGAAIHAIGVRCLRVAPPSLYQAAAVPPATAGAAFSACTGLTG